MPLKKSRADFYEHTYIKLEDLTALTKEETRELHVCNVLGLGAAFQFSSDSIVTIRGCSSVSIEVTRLVNV